MAKKDQTNVILNVVTKVMDHIKIGEYLFVPSIFLENGKKGILIISKKQAKQFMKSEIDFFQKLSNILSLALYKNMSEQANQQKVNYLNIAQNVSRRIIDDSNLDDESTIIRDKLQLHSCIFFLFNRHDNIFRVDGIASVLPKPVINKLKSFTMSPEVLNNTGYSFSELHKIKATKISEYIKVIKKQTKNQTELLSKIMKYSDCDLFQAPLFDSFRRLIGLLILVKKPNRHIHPLETDLVEEFSTKVANALEIKQNIYSDPITGLSNLKRFKTFVVEKLISAESFSLFICKILNLKKIVISRGDDIGDNCMVLVTKKIKERILKQSKNILFARNSGEAAFMFAFPSTNNKKINNFSQQLIKCITEPLMINGNSIHLQVNIGISHSTDIWDTDMIFTYSKLGIKAIAANKNSSCIFTPEMQIAYSNEKELEEDIRDSLYKNNFIAHYQPKILCDGNIHGYEALARWQRGDRIEYPGLFIQKTEEMGLIQILFNNILESVCQDITQNEFLSNVSVNISPLQLANTEVLDKISSIMSHYNVDPHKITFELVETAIVNSEYYSIIKALKNNGHKISVDDFGTGYARYETLLKLFDQGFVDEVKIDKAFIDKLVNPAYQSFVQSIIFLTKEFDMRIVVEGVETMEQYSILKAINPNIIIQGWLISKAIPLKLAKQFKKKQILDILFKD